MSKVLGTGLNEGETFDKVKTGGGVKLGQIGILPFTNEVRTMDKNRVKTE